MSANESSCVANLSISNPPHKRSPHPYNSSDIKARLIKLWADSNEKSPQVRHLAVIALIKAVMHTPLSLLLRRSFLPEIGRNILLCGFQLEQFFLGFLVLLVELCLFGGKLRILGFQLFREIICRIFFSSPTYSTCSATLISNCFPFVFATTIRNSSWSSTRRIMDLKTHCSWRTMATPVQTLTVRLGRKS